MALGGIDLNLLVTLQALLEEGNVTRAGVRMGMPQPAMSNALARLRRHYKDELLLRTGNGYELTPLARTLLPMVRGSTQLIGHVFALGEQRHALVGDRVFTISLSDYAMTVLGKPLLRRVHELAPDASVQMRLATAEVADRDRGLLGYDLLIAPAGFRPDGEPEVILRDRFVYVADPANPRLAGGRLTVEDLAALPHAAARLPQAELAAAPLPDSRDRPGGRRPRTPRPPPEQRGRRHSRRAPVRNPRADRSRLVAPHARRRPRPHLAPRHRPGDNGLAMRLSPVRAPGGHRGIWQRCPGRTPGGPADRQAAMARCGSACLITVH